MQLLGGSLSSNRQPASLSVVVYSVWFSGPEVKHGGTSSGVESLQLSGWIRQQLPPSISVFIVPCALVCAHCAPHTPDGCVSACLGVSRVPVWPLPRAPADNVSWQMVVSLCSRGQLFRSRSLFRSVFQPVVVNVSLTEQSCLYPLVLSVYMWFNRQIKWEHFPSVQLVLFYKLNVWFFLHKSGWPDILVRVVQCEINHRELFTLSRLW